MTASIDALELAAAQAWRAPDEARLGEWLLRAADGFTSRANSVLALGDPGLPLPAAIDQVLDWYRGRDLPAQVAIAYPPDGPAGHPIDGLLADLGWTVRGGALVMTGPLSDITGLMAAGDAARVEVLDEPDNGWLDCYRWHEEVPAPVSRQVFVSAPWQAFGAIRAVGETVSIGRVAIAAGWAGLTAIRVDPQHRRPGLAQLMTVALAQKAKSRGAHGLYLQVETGNAAARALYERMGFTYHHAYHFRLAPDRGPAEAGAGAA
jgi:ribosomal protein S18 acetylase RimI-like enzyme